VLRTVTASRYVTPLREGGSLPAIVEADDGRLYVLKFRGAGQGQRALIAELVSGSIGQVLGLKVPEIVLVDVDPVLARSEPDPEIRDLILSSAGLNLALVYLPGSVAFDPALAPPPEPELASTIVWFDGFVTNVDRTARNTNMLIWQRELWLIDHGATLYFHHAWDDYLGSSKSAFPLIKDHVLLGLAGLLREVDSPLGAQLTDKVLRGIVDEIPSAWLGDVQGLDDVEDHRAAYLAFLRARLEAPRAFVEEALHARDRLV
jgi:hypothetical protein